MPDRHVTDRDAPASPLGTPQARAWLIFWIFVTAAVTARLAALAVDEASVSRTLWQMVFVANAARGLVRSIERCVREGRA